ncbi:hypothetical protein SMICM17S_08493 [Streptomyces microflavus]
MCEACGQLPAPAKPPPPRPAPGGRNSSFAGSPYGAVRLESDADPAVKADDPCGPRHYRRTRDCRYRYRSPEQAVPPGDRARPAHVGHRTRCDRSGGFQRSRQVHTDQDPSGSLPRHRGPGRSARARRGDERCRHPGAGGVHAGTRLPPARCVGHRVCRAHGSHVGAAADRGPGAHRRHPAPRRPLRGALPPHRRLLDRYEAAGEAGPGPGPRPPAGPPRRADQRPGPGRPRRDARPDPPDPHRLRHLRPGRPRTSWASWNAPATTSSSSTAEPSCAPAPPATSPRSPPPSRSR